MRVKQAGRDTYNVIMSDKELVDLFSILHEQSFTLSDGRERRSLELAKELAKAKPEWRFL